ncbi:MAG: HlyD family secretion protein [Bacteroidales bacterium]|nr:HlyD family secretion protein [Bacteroidales bacterium]
MTEETNKPAGEKPKKKYRYSEIAAVILLVAGSLWIVSLFLDFSLHIKTNNAQVDADLVAVTSRVSGFIREIRFDAYNTVNKGDTLVLLDDEEFAIKVAQAAADLELARASLRVARQAVVTSESQEASAIARLQGNTASLERAEKNFRRYENMFADSAVTRNQYDQVIAQWKTDQAYLEAGEKEVLASRSAKQQNIINVGAAEASVKRKEADLNAAMLQLSYTVIVAPADGIAGERTIHTGELVNVSQVLLEMVLQNKKWVTANFKETQLSGIRAGQKAIIEVDALGGKSFNGIIRNLSPATGARFSMVAPDNSTGNFVKITQRVPVRIEFEAEGPELVEVRPGMNVTVRIKK